MTTGLLAAASATAGVISPRTLVAVEKTQTRSSGMISAYITAEEGCSPWDALKGMGVIIDVVADRFATVRIQPDLLSEAAETEGVAYIQIADRVDSMLDEARKETGLENCWQTTTPEIPAGFNGKDVVVGIIDAGMDYAHEAFRDSEGNLRIERVWEQSTQPQGGNSSPEKFGYGLELKDPQSILKAEADIIDNSHGTHVAAIAAGSSDFSDGLYRGVAPASRIVLVSMGASSRDNVNLTNAISYIFDYAESLGLPCVINLSLGNHAGPHDGTSMFDMMADALSGPGRILVGSAGNHGCDHFHIEKDWSEGDRSPLRTFIDFKTKPSANTKGGDLELWFSSRMENYKVYLICWSESKGEETERIELDLSETDVIKEAEFSSNIKGKITYGIGSNPVSGKTMVYLNSGITSVRSRYSLGLEIVPSTEGHADIWADNIYFGLTSGGVEGWSDSNGSTIAEIGGTAARMLSVGSYTTRNSYLLEGSTATQTLPETIGEVSSFSSYGPTADGRIKPEITAPGCFIISAVSRHDNSGNLLVAATHSVDGDRDYKYGYMQGTSMSAPFAAGTVALWLQADPTLTPEKVKDIATRSARDEGHDPDSRRGYGKISPKAGLDLVISESGVSEIQTGGKTFYAEGGRGVLRVHAAEGESVEIYAADGSRVAALRGSSEISLQAGLYVARSRNSSVKVLVR